MFFIKKKPITSSIQKKNYPTFLKENPPTISCKKKKKKNCPISHKKKISSFICSSLPLYNIVVPQTTSPQYSFSFFFVLSVSYMKIFSMVQHFLSKLVSFLTKFIFYFLNYIYCEWIILRPL